MISQSFFKSRKGGEGFRKFEITRGGSKIPLRVERVLDMVKVKPFREVANRTSVMLIEKGKPTKYPARYIVWKPKEHVDETDSLTTVHRKVQQVEMEAVPIGGTNTEKGRRTPWLTLPPGRIEKLSRIIGKSDYRGRKGVEPLGAKGVYVLKEPTSAKGRRLHVVNDLRRGRLREIEQMGERPGLIEEDFVYPMVSGRNFGRYGASDYAYILLPHRNKKGPHNAVPDGEMKVKYTETYKWLAYWKEVLLETRKRNGKFFDAKVDPFYALDNVGLYTFAPYKVAWREQGARMTACVLSAKPDPPLEGKIIIPDSKVLFCPLEDKDEAHYLCALLNSETVTEIVDGYALELQRGIDVLDNVQIPQYDPKNALCRALSKLSQDAHARHKKGESVSAVQRRIDEVALEFLENLGDRTLTRYQ